MIRKLKSINQLKVGAALSYLNIIVVNCIGLILTPFIIRSLGDSEYGLYTLIGSFVAYLTLMDLGLNNTIVRFVSKYRAEKDREEEKKFLGRIYVIYGAISLLVTMIGLILYFNIETIFSESLSIDQIKKAKVMYLILVFNIAISLPGGSFTAICNAYEHFVFPRVINFVRYLVRAITVVAVLKLGGKAISLVILDTILNIIGITTLFLYTKRNIKIRVVFSNIRFSTIIPIFNYSIWIFIIAITQSFQWNAGQLVLGINVNTVTVAVYAVGIMLGTYYGAFAGAINTLLLPKANQMVVQDKSPNELTLIIIKVGRLCNGISLLILSGFYLFGETFIHLWVGDGYRESWLVAFLVMLVTTIPLSQSFGHSILEAQNKIRFKALANLATIIIGVLIGLVLSKKFGIKGMIYPLTAAMFMNVIISNLYFRYVFGFKILLFYSKVYFKQTLLLLFLVISGNYILNYLSISFTWTNLGITIAIYTIIYSMAFYFFIMNIEEKSLLRRALS
ncbi:oligosaccharide flippase family protein [Saccharicrinis aurantiacus]|uniref:oligosaccharide flippase family protein n=1 Tax=Saccharicrinis aurantiacus TaxID=1849719 RepID=UPI00248F4F59|nr:oligosaccharide flippase family protein [Saccharicrinis aurantiacus]